jgi:hypothetical protein
MGVDDSDPLAARELTLRCTSDNPARNCEISHVTSRQNEFQAGAFFGEQNTGRNNYVSVLTRQPEGQIDS